MQLASKTSNLNGLNELSTRVGAHLFWWPHASRLDVNVGYDDVDSENDKLRKVTN